MFRLLERGPLDQPGADPVNNWTTQLERGPLDQPGAASVTNQHGMASPLARGRASSPTRATVSVAVQQQHLQNIVIGMRPDEYVARRGVSAVVR